MSTEYYKNHAHKKIIDILEQEIAQDYLNDQDKIDILKAVLALYEKKNNVVSINKKEDDTRKEQMGIIQQFLVEHVNKGNISSFITIALRTDVDDPIVLAAYLDANRAHDRFTLDSAISQASSIYRQQIFQTTL